MATPYRDIPYKLSNHLPFFGSSMSALTDTTGVYRVYSYTTEIASVGEAGVEILDENRWGPTTGRHLNLCRANL